MKKIMLTAAAVATLASSSAFADSEFYLKANVGAVKLNKFGDLKSNNTAFFGVGVGYHVMENTRVELMFSHLVNPTHKASGNGASIKAKSDVNALLVNGFYDFADLGAVKLFAGAGIGAAQISTKFSSTPAVIDSAQIDGAKLKKKTNFAYAAYLGASSEIAQGVNAELTYSYRGYGKPKGTEISKKTNFRGHHIAAGIRFDI